MMSLPWLTILAVLPLVGSLLLIVVKGAAAKQVALVISLLTLLVAILIAYMGEALVLGALGGIVGILITYFAMNGVNTGTINWQSFSEVSFAFRVTPILAVIAIAFASVIGALGGLLPATLAARARITQALRQI